MLLLDGTICHAIASGNELESFSKKFQRLVLLAYHDPTDGYVYPLSSSKSEGAIRLERPGAKVAWLVVRHGLFRVPLSSLTETEHRWAKFSSLRERIEGHLAEREVRNLNSNADLTHRALEVLSEFRQEVPIVPKKKPEVVELSDEELFQKYLDRFDPRGS